LELRVVPTRAWVRSDRRLLRRVLQNLLSNAIKYTPAGKVVLGVRRRGAELAVQVFDTGPGIPQAKRALVFKEFERLKETASVVRGLGLGLSIVERIGKVLGHRIVLQSEPGRGSVFSVELPRAEPRAAPAPGAATPFAGRISGLTVLCIDNEPAVLAGMRALLQGWGCAVLTARDGKEAIDQLREEACTPDIILVDYHLDEGTGLQAVAALRTEMGPQIPVIIITADPSAEVQREARRRGCALLRKPLKAAALRALMYQLSRQRTIAAE
jgi:CheY-like chemotaxis protein/anti-sigma regulatory factor (Ser/Thr protein kinase)